MASVEGPSRADTQPDVMNDPAYATNIESKNKALDEPDTCRICRGEGSKQDPLFYPCKCSGSIKFVHQNCLMEWLSHSQKKHCELCKTPFRFTKLYHPQMPPTLPAPIFLRQALIHSLRSLVTWSRLVLVIFVWLGWLPWTMRAVWRGLFWLADGGWADIHRLDPGTALAAQHRPADLVSNATSPAGQALPLSKEAAASALVSGMANIISPILSHISRALNFTAGEPTFYGFAKGVFSTSFHRLANSIVPSSLYTASGISNNTNPDQKHPSWLSNVKMLKTLTRSQFLNDLLIDTLEGQLITLLVVIAFVLVFLIREWVVQQQPGANMGAGFNAAVAERQARENVPLQQPANPNEQPGLEQQGRPNDAEPDDDQDNRARVVDGVGVLRPRAMARPRNRRRLQAPPAEGRAQPDDHSVGFPDQSSRAPIADDETAIFGNKLPEGEVFHFGSSSEGQKLSGRQRPVMRTRSAFARAVEIQRTIDEEKRASGNQDWPGLEVFMDLWQRADSKPEKVLNIIEAEHRTAELGWIVSAMKRLQNVDSLPELPNEDSTLAPDNEVFEDEHISDGSSQSWQDVSRPTDGDAAVTPLPGIGSSDVAPVVENSREERELSPGNEVLDTQTSRAESPNAVGHWVDKGKGRATEAPDLTDSVAPLEDLTKKRTDDEFPRLRRSVNRIGRIEPITALPTTLSDDPGDDVITEEPSGSEGKMSEQLSVSEKSKEHLTGAPIEESGHPEPQDGRDADLTPDGNLPDIQEDSQPHLQSNHLVANDAPAASQNLTDKVMAWLWGGITTPGLEQDRREEMIDENDERLVQDFADEAPFVPVFNGHHAAQVDLAEGQLAEGPELGAAEAEAGPDPNDQDAIDEGEDLEGVMELIGMQGPLTGLVQNAMFSAVLISTTVAAGIWLPYIWGKFVLLLLANPITMMIRLPLRWLSFTADSIVDVCIIFGSCLIYWIAIVFQTCLIPLGMVFPIIAQFTHHSSLAAAARSVAEGGLERLAKMVIATSSGFSETEFPIFSIVSHEALHTLETHIGNGFKICFYFIPKTIQSLVLQALHNSNLNDSPKTTLFATASRLSILALGNASDIVRYMRLILKANPSSISLEYPRRTLPLDYSLAYWNSKDRFITIILGYAFFAIAGFIYLRISGSFGKAQHGERVAGFVAEILQQAGGVVKVILIISIEMIVFPLYCGLLLDVALLPLFANVTLMSRVSFTADSPSTSLFVHWFVGTCYMFHFALFVSMCRKIMRSGVLCKYLPTPSPLSLVLVADFREIRLHS